MLLFKTIPVYVITLYGCEETRLKDTLKWLKWALPPQTPINIIKNHRDSENPTRGCYNAHRQALLDAYHNKNVTKALVIEDDVDYIFDEHGTKEELWQRVEQVFSEYPDLGLLYLYHHPKRPTFPTKKLKGVVHAPGSTGACATFVCNDMMKLIVDTPYNADEKRAAIDNYYERYANACHGQKSFAIRPMACVQRDIPSTIRNNSLTKNFESFYLKTTDQLNYRPYMHLILFVVACLVIAVVILRKRNL